MGAETSWNSIILAPTWKQVGGFSYCLTIKIQRTYLSICWLNADNGVLTGKASMKEAS